jgi:uncharacterized protein
MTTPSEVIARRRADREALLRSAREYVEGLAGDLDVLAAVVVGSVARGDFHDASDVDLIVVVGDLPDDAAARWSLVAPRHGVVQPIAWTAEEWHGQCQRRNPLAVDAVAHGVWLVGSPDVL